jgi:hypothetical protein
MQAPEDAVWNVVAREVASLRPSIFVYTNLNEHFEKVAKTRYRRANINQRIQTERKTKKGNTFVRVSYVIRYVLNSDWTKRLFSYLSISGGSFIRGTAVAQKLTCCVTNRKVAGSIPSGVRGFFIVIKYSRSHYGPGVDSASNRNEYQEHFLGVKAAGA